MAILVIMLSLIRPALNALKGAGDITSAAYDVAGAIQKARAYAMAHNTYAWVGFYEEDANASVPTNSAPPYAGKGKVVMAIIASKDGTPIVDDTATGTVTLDPLRFDIVYKPTRITGIHLADIGPPSGSASNDSRSDNLSTRSDLPYDAASQGQDASKSRISSDSSNQTTRPFSVQGYTFYKTIRFNPREQANLNGTYPVQRVAEIGLLPTHGSVVDTKAKNVAAIQVTGIGGKVNIYRP